MNHVPNDKKNESQLIRSSFESDVQTSVATRTLVAAGFTITDFRRPGHGEYICERSDVFGVPIPYVVAVYDQEPIEREIDYARRIAERDGRIFIPIAPSSSGSCIAWSDFLEMLGGAVPTWRALNESYQYILKTASKNEVPNGLTGEAWQIFEDATADGFEFLFGRRVRRLGGRKRGRRLGDMITQTSDSKILLIDAKASIHNYNVGGPELRPLIEYVKNQKIRQRGRLELSAAVLIADQFEQNFERLYELSGEFISETGVPLTFLEVDNFLRMIDQMKRQPTMRNTLCWARIFCTGGLIKRETFEQELRSAIEETYAPEKGL